MFLGARVGDDAEALSLSLALALPLSLGKVMHAAARAGDARLVRLFAAHGAEVGAPSAAASRGPSRI